MAWRRQKYQPRGPDSSDCDGPAHGSGCNGARFRVFARGESLRGHRMRVGRTTNMSSEWHQIEPLAVAVATAELKRMGRSRDLDLLDRMLAECMFRTIKMTVDLAGDALKAYLRRTFQGACRDAADDPTCGPSLKNARRRKEPIEPLKRQSWPSERGGMRSIGPLSAPNHDGKRPAIAPPWTYDRDRGAEWKYLVDWVAKTAKRIATGRELLAVNQILDERSDRQVCRKAGLGKSAWAEQRVKLLKGLAPRIVAAADYHVDALGEKYLGILWAEPGKRSERAVKYKTAA